MSERFNSNYEKEKISTSILKNNLFNPESSEDENTSYNRESHSPFNNNNHNINKTTNIQNNKINNNINERNFSTREDEKINRVRKLSEKLSKLQIQEKENPSSKLVKLETKFEAVEENLQYSLETLKSKYNTLKEHTAIMKKRLEEESENKEDLKRNITEKLKNLQTRVKTMILEEKEHFKFYTDNICTKLEAELIKCETEIKKDDDTLLKNINDIKESIRVRIILN